MERAFYENECLKGNWSKRQLQRQISVLLYERTGLSTDKQAVIEHAHQQAAAAPVDLPASFTSDEGKRLLESMDKDEETISFRVNGRIAVADPELRRWWTEQVPQGRAVFPFAPSTRIPFRARRRT